MAAVRASGVVKRFGTTRALGGVASGRQVVNPLYTIYGCFNTL